MGWTGVGRSRGGCANMLKAEVGGEAWGSVFGLLVARGGRAGGRGHADLGDLDG
jgi:hypothetical protein